ncbi:hypothetical protein STVIR_5502 [Streptomyces viridochromogenes Tue57]|uniref:Uncharacterized protein n=1 Tax=Streptomyces viridochromogenes Tue57 TaxID=1160705 RepID=L8PE10_STRVR|nr:hypothetical protein STVIR_5502 [Streptomyces viridochromogenes Tue57]
MAYGVVESSDSPFSNLWRKGRWKGEGGREEVFGGSDAYVTRTRACTALETSCPGLYRAGGPGGGG